MATTTSTSSTSRSTTSSSRSTTSSSRSTSSTSKSTSTSSTSKSTSTSSTSKSTSSSTSSSTTTIMYDLLCGNCVWTGNPTSAGDTAIGWLCSSCTNTNVTSLPTETDNVTLIYDPARAKSIHSGGSSSPTTVVDLNEGTP